MTISKVFPEPMAQCVLCSVGIPSADIVKVVGLKRGGGLVKASNFKGTPLGTIEKKKG